MTKNLQFYNQLEAKICSNCGASFEEQCESYQSACPDCSWTPADKGLTLHVKESGWDWK
jgi:protein-arginine kinase activator protein McsA